MTRLTVRLRYPALPSSVAAAGGVIRVRQIKPPVMADNDTVAWGTWDDATRIIRLDKSATREHRWRVFFHELTHAALHDAGLKHLLTEDAEEALCDAIASARMAEFRATLHMSR